jgi:hypothetical protein
MDAANVARVRDSIRGVFIVLGAVALLGPFAACRPAIKSGPTVPSAASATPEEPAGCQTAVSERARAKNLFAAGKLDRARRVIARADALCPASASESRDVLAATLAELEPSDNVLTARALLISAFGARTAGNGDRAQRLFDRTMLAIERESGTRVGVALGPANPTARWKTLAWSPDGSLLAVGNGEEIVIRDRALGFRETVRLTGHAQHIYTVAFDPSGDMLASASQDRTVRLWNVAKGTEVRRLAHDGHVTSLAFAAAGDGLVSGSVDGKARIWNVASGELARAFDASGEVFGVAIAPNGDSIAASTKDGKIQLWSADGAPKRTIAVGVAITALHS